MWFHEYLSGGPNQGDSVYADFNKVQLYSYLVQSLLTGVSAYFDQGHPVSFSANIITVIFGGLVYALINSRGDLNAESEYTEEYEGEQVTEADADLWM